MDKQEQSLRAMAILQSLAKNLRTGLVDEDWIIQYHRALDILAGLKHDIDEWRISPSALSPISDSGSSKRYAPATMARTRIDAVIRYLQSTNIVKDRDQETKSSVRPDADKESGHDPDRCFVLMPFLPELNVVYTEAIKRAAEAEALHCERADDTARPGVVLDQIDESIERARVIVADLTGHNPNVMHEVGFARAHGKPIIFITQGEFRDLPFDVRHYRAFRYRQDPEGLAALSDWLRLSFQAVLGEPAADWAEVEPLQFSLNWVQQNIQPKLEAVGDELIYPGHDRADQYRLEGWENVFWPDERGRRRRVLTADHTPLRRRRVSVSQQRP